MTIEVTVLYFAKSREVAGLPQESLQLDEGITTNDLLVEIVKRHPGMESVLKTCVLALNQEYVNQGDALTLKGGDEIAVIPPLSGG